MKNCWKLVNKEHVVILLEGMKKVDTIILQTVKNIVQ